MSSPAKVVGITSDGSTIESIFIRFGEGSKTYIYSDNKLTQHELQEMKRLGEAGTGLVRFMRSNGILSRND